MWRTHDWVLHAVQTVRDQELAVLAEHFGFRLARDDLDTVLALIDGLLVAVCQPRRPLARPEASRLLQRALDRLIPGGDEANAA